MKYIPLAFEVALIAGALIRILQYQFGVPHRVAKAFAFVLLDGSWLLPRFGWQAGKDNFVFELSDHNGAAYFSMYIQ